MPPRLRGKEEGPPPYGEFIVAPATRVIETISIFLEGKIHIYDL
jgi:hypothetical protein